MTWHYQGEVFNPEESELEPYIGFVYCITEIDTGKKYIGKKNFWSTRRLPPLKGKKRKRVVKKESDWQTYYGSNEQLKLLVEERGGDAYHREILKLCKSKGELSYAELVEQVEREVLLRDDYYNGIIQVRISSKHLKV